jgi:hypothetical protein
MSYGLSVVALIVDVAAQALPGQVGGADVVEIVVDG